LRLLQVPELRRAKGFPETFRLDRGSRRERIKLLGNAVCPPVMQAIVEGLIADRAAAASLVAAA
jgi:DNA (cytosine-5)-methyltransferase 1